MFDEKSRYANAKQKVMKDRRDRLVTVVGIPEPPQQSILGFHLMKQGQRLDHLSYQYLKDAPGWWRICEANETMLPEALSEAKQVAIPQKTR